MLRAGAARVDITPSAGEAIPGQWLSRRSTGVRDPLYATALILESGSTRTALVSCDVLSLRNHMVRQVRTEVAARFGIRPERLLLHATHTHDGPPIADALGTAIDEGWVVRVTAAIIDALSKAAKCLRPASIAWHALPAPGLAFPRRYHFVDGSVRMHPAGDDPGLLRPEGVPDEVLTAMGVFDEVGVPIAIVVSFACHPVCIGSALHYSADYPGALRVGLWGLWGDETEVLYLNGFSADVGPDDVDDARSGYGEAGLRYLGGELAARLSPGLRAAPRAGQPRIEGSLVPIELRLRVPDSASLEAAQRTFTGDPSEIPQDTELIKARELILLDREVRERPTVRAEITLLRVGDGLLIGWPSEVFSAYGRRVRRLSPLQHTMPVSLANGCHGYIPTPEAFAGGGYETWLCRSSKLEQTAGDKLLLATRDALAAMREPAPGQR